MRSHTVIASFLLSVFLLMPLAVLADEDSTEENIPEIEPVVVQEVLITNMIPLALPAFHDAERAGATWDDLLAGMPPLPGSSAPRKGDSFAGIADEIDWHQVSAGDGLILRSGKTSAARYVAFYITTDRWQSLVLKVTSDDPVLGILGKESLSFSSDEGEEGATTTHTVEVDVMIGQHLVILRTMHLAESESAWEMSLSVTPSQNNTLGLSVVPQHAVDIETVLNAPRVGSVSISSDGTLCAISLSEYTNGSDRESWLEVRETESHKLVRLWRGQHAPGGIAWHPTGHRITWRIDSGETASLHTYDLDTGETEIVLANVADLGSWRWAPDGDSIVYSINRTATDDPRQVKRVMYLADRQSWWRNRSHLMQVAVPSGVRRRLTAGPVSADS